MPPQCDEDFGCGKETNILFSVAVKDWTHERADSETGIVLIRVCRDCVASGDWED